MNTIELNDVPTTLRRMDPHGLGQIFRFYIESVILHETIPAKIRHLLCTGPETSVGPLSELECYRIGLAGLPRRSPDKYKHGSWYDTSSVYGMLTQHFLATERR